MKHGRENVALPAAVKATVKSLTMPPENQTAATAANGTSAAEGDVAAAAPPTAATAATAATSAANATTAANAEVELPPELVDEVRLSLFRSGPW